MRQRHESLYLGQNSQQEPAVGDHLSNPPAVAGDDGHDVRDEMGNSAERQDERTSKDASETTKVARA